MFLLIAIGSIIIWDNLKEDTLNSFILHRNTEIHQLSHAQISNNNLTSAS